MPGTTCYKVDTSKNRSTTLNSNGSEYYGAFKVCIPVDTDGHILGAASGQGDVHGGHDLIALRGAHRPQRPDRVA